MKHIIEIHIIIKSLKAFGQNLNASKKLNKLLRQNKHKDISKYLL